ncbi:MAG TPA: TlpA disulfide reductase family protein [Streptosporangiaceae bacterium]
MIANLRGRALLPSAVLASAMLAAGVCVAGCGPRALATGEMARGFTLPALDDRRPVSLSRYAGRPVVINFFASWSPPCTAETQLLAHFYRFYHGKVAIVGVDTRDDRAAAIALLRASGVTYPVGADPHLVVSARYHVPGVPATYFLDAQHQIVRTSLGWLSWKKLRAGVALSGVNLPAPRG